MNSLELSPASQHFVDYFAALGPRWGLPAEACRVHAYLYLITTERNEQQISDALGLGEQVLSEALHFLDDYRMIERAGPETWHASGDPWDMLLRGLEERRRRELPEALSTLQRCRDLAGRETAVDRMQTRQIEKMLALAEDLSALDRQSRHLSPRVVRGLLGVSGRAARFIDRTFGPTSSRPKKGRTT